MSAPGDSSRVTHSFQKSALIRARLFARQLNFDINGSAIRNAVAHNIGLAVLTNVDDAAVLSVELSYRMIPNYAAVLTEGYEDFVL